MLIPLEKIDQSEATKMCFRPMRDVRNVSFFSEETLNRLKLIVSNVDFMFNAFLDLSHKKGSISLDQIRFHSASRLVKFQAYNNENDYMEFKS